MKTRCDSWYNNYLADFGRTSWICAAWVNEDTVQIWGRSVKHGPKSQIMHSTHIKKEKKEILKNDMLDRRSETPLIYSVVLLHVFYYKEMFWQFLRHALGFWQTQTLNFFLFCASKSWAEASPSSPAAAHPEPGSPQHGGSPGRRTPPARPASSPSPRSGRALSASVGTGPEQSGRWGRGEKSSASPALLPVSLALLPFLPRWPRTRLFASAGRRPRSRSHLRDWPQLPPVPIAPQPRRRQPRCRTLTAPLWTLSKFPLPPGYSHPPSETLISLTATTTTIRITADKTGASPSWEGWFIRQNQRRVKPITDDRKISGSVALLYKIK